MNGSMIVAVLSLIGTLVGTFGGILTANRLTNFRIQELEKKVDKHNNFAGRIPVIEEQIKVINHRVDELEREKYHHE